MTLRRALNRALDRPGGRALLGIVVARGAQAWAPRVRVYFQHGMWMHRVTDVVFVDVILDVGVVAIEAHPVTFRCLRLFCELNPFRNIEPLHLTLYHVAECAKLTRIDLLKLNMEGGEIGAIQRMAKTPRMTRALSISRHDLLAAKGGPLSFRTKAQVQDAIQRDGFTMVSRDADPRPYIRPEACTTFDLFWMS